MDNGLIELGIIHSFEFVSSLRRMSVIVRDLSKPHMEVFVKGAPEVMSEVCLPETSKFIELLIGTSVVWLLITTHLSPTRL
jgi:magnesium-transporting ATPase (P-type)